MAAEAYGWEINPDPEDDEPVDPVEQLRREVEQDRADRAAREQQAQQEAHAQEEDKRINAELDELGIESQSERDLIFRSALVAKMTGQSDSVDVKSAAKELEAVWTDRQKNWADGKANAQPTAAGGVSATGVPDLDNMTDAERHDWLREQVRLRAEAQAQ
jgi:hypothetical protein